MNSLLKLAFSTARKIIFAVVVLQLWEGKKPGAVLHVVFHLIPENSVVWWSHFGYDSREVVNSLNFY